MITRHIRIECDTPHCTEALLSPPLDFLDAKAQTAHLWKTAEARGWHALADRRRNPAALLPGPPPARRRTARITVTRL